MSASAPPTGQALPNQMAMEFRCPVRVHGTTHKSGRLVLALTLALALPTLRPKRCIRFYDRLQLINIILLFLPLTKPCSLLVTCCSFACCSLSHAFLIAAPISYHCSCSPFMHAAAASCCCRCCLYTLLTLVRAYY